MKIKLNFTYLIFVVICVDSSVSQIVRLKNNFVLKGTVSKTLRGREIYSFLRVPYAEPPIGELRFKAPVPWKNFDENNEEVVLDCTKDAPICTQRNPYVRDEKVSGEEDCLYLSIHTPKLKIDEKNQTLLPVMVFLHGGGFMCGAGISTYYGPEHLLDRDVILVGVNYRLGPLGFLSTGDLNCPGNNGLKDQNLALKWIKNNIQSFQGNPELITLFGESAGGASVDYHMLSPKSEGLFQRAIAQSGTSLCPWAAPPVPGEPETRARILAQKLNCLDENEKEDWPKILKCLKKVPAEEVTNVFYEFFKWDTDPMIAFPPVVEPEHPDAFITEHPRKILEKSAKMKVPYWGAKIPLMTGVTKDEGALKTASLFGMPHLAEDLDANWNDIAPVLLQYESHHLNDGGSRAARLSRAIRDAYLPDGAAVCEETRRNVTDMMSDHWFVSCMHETVRLRTKLAPEIRDKTFVYLFAYRGAASFTRIFGDKERDYGVCHADELQYLFPVGKDLFPEIPLTEQDKQMVQRMIELWTNFAANGVPSFDDENNSADQPSWPEHTEKSRKEVYYYRIDQECKIETDLFTSRADFWLNLPMPWREERMHRYFQEEQKKGDKDEL